jgi:PEP-CTERM motif
MMRAFLQCGLIVTAIFGAPNTAQAQLMLIGCTGNTSNTGPPSSIVDIDLTSGAATNPRNTGILLIGGIATQPSTGFVFGLTTFASTPDNTLIRLNVASGGFTLVGPTGSTNIVEGDLAFNPVNGALYGLQDFGPTFDQRNLFRINPSTGAATVIGSLNSDGDYSALAFNASGVLFTIDDSPSGNSLLHTIDPNTGAITSTITMNVRLGHVIGMTFNPANGAAYVADGGLVATNMLYGLDVITGVATAIGPLGIPGGVGGIAFVSVPEPSSLTLLGIVTMIAARFFGRCVPVSKRPIYQFDHL